MEPRTSKPAVQFLVVTHFDSHTLLKNAPFLPRCYAKMDPWWFNFDPCPFVLFVSPCSHLDAKTQGPVAGDTRLNGRALSLLQSAKLHAVGHARKQRITSSQLVLSTKHHAGLHVLQYGSEVATRLWGGLTCLTWDSSPSKLPVS